MLCTHLKDLPNEWHRPLVAAHVFADWTVEALGREGMYSGPAVFTVVLEATDRAAVERGKFPVTLDTMALITHLVVHHIRFDFNLRYKVHNIFNWTRIGRDLGMKASVCVHACVHLCVYVQTNPFIAITIGHLKEASGYCSHEAVG